MPDVLVRNVEDDLLQSLKERAKNNGRSLQKELKLLLRSFVEDRPVSGEETTAKIREALRDRKFPNTTELIREQRNRL